MDLTQLSSQLKVKTDFDAGSMLGLRDINSITGIVDNSITSVQALIFKNEDPQYDDIDTTNFDRTGITSGYDKVAFIFDLKKEYKLNLSSDITDHYVEDNVAIQDHIGLKPVILDVSGSVGEVNLYDKNRKAEITKNEDSQFNSLDSFLYRMGSLTAFAPNILNQAVDIYNTANYVYSTASKLINSNKKTKKKSGYDYTEKVTEETIENTNQSYWINWFKTQWEHRASFSIVTPYGVLTDMYIMELSASQPENTRYVTNLNIKFKQIKKAKVIASEKKVSQKMDIQQSKTQEEKKEETQEQITPEISQEEKVQEAISKAKENPGGVSQVTKEEFEKRRAEVISMNVEAATQNFTPSVGQIQKSMPLYGVGTAVGG